MVSVCVQKEKTKNGRTDPGNTSASETTDVSRALFICGNVFTFFILWRSNSQSLSSIIKATLISTYRWICLMMLCWCWCYVSFLTTHEWSPKRVMVISYRSSAYIDSLHFNLRWVLLYKTIIKGCCPSQWPESADVANVIILQHNHTLSAIFLRITKQYWWIEVTAKF